MNAINVFITPDGETLEIPDEVYAATKFAKSGWPDKRVKANVAFYEWLSNAERDARNASMEGADAVVSLHQAEMRRGVGIAALGSSEINPAQGYADRVWAGQSESADRPWRLSRVKEALEGQGLSMDGVELPG